MFSKKDTHAHTAGEKDQILLPNWSIMKSDHTKKILVH